jgi:putative membrane protein
MGFTIAISKDRVPLRRNVWILDLLQHSFVWANSLIGTTDLTLVPENTLSFIFISSIITYKKHQSATIICSSVFTCAHVYGSKHLAENPFGYWLQGVFHTRNHYDRIVHFSLAFVSHPMREMFLKWLKYPTWVACYCQLR